MKPDDKQNKTNPTLFLGFFLKVDMVGSGAKVLYKYV